MPEDGQSMTKTCSIHYRINIIRAVVSDGNLYFTVSLYNTVGQIPSK